MESIRKAFQYCLSEDAYQQVLQSKCLAMERLTNVREMFIEALDDRRIGINRIASPSMVREERRKASKLKHMSVAVDKIWHKLKQRIRFRVESWIQIDH